MVNAQTVGTAGVPNVMLNNGIEMPRFGLGTYMNADTNTNRCSNGL